MLLNKIDLIPWPRKRFYRPADDVALHVLLALGICLNCKTCWGVALSSHSSSLRVTFHSKWIIVWPSLAMYICTYGRWTLSISRIYIEAGRNVRTTSGGFTCWDYLVKIWIHNGLSSTMRKFCLSCLSTFVPAKILCIASLKTPKTMQTTAKGGSMSPHPLDPESWAHICYATRLEPQYQTGDNLNAPSPVATCNTPSKLDTTRPGPSRWSRRLWDSGPV